jgi:DNA-directed RNA polymerase specialized sigma24 family protein
LLHATLSDSFTEWAESVEPKLRHALTASFGPQVGKDVAVDALSHAWEHWDRIRGMENPAGYVFGIARNKARRVNDDRPIGFPAVSQRLPDVEPGLPNAVAMLSDQQRIVVTLLYGYQWTMTEVADFLGTSKTTIQNHAERGLARLRSELGVDR